MPCPKISIIIPIYNAERYIHRCIDSILAQTFTDFECILVDDCTPDNSGKICDEYAKKDERVKVIHSGKNKGSSLSRKIGLDNSSGKYILYVDADDYIETFMVEMMYKKAATQNYDIVYCDFYKYSKENPLELKKVPFLLTDSFVSNCKRCILDLGFGYLWNKLVKRTIYEKVEFPVDNFHEDLFISTQVLFFSNKFGYVSEALYHYTYNHFSQFNNKQQIWNRHREGKNNLKRIIHFLRINHGEDLSVFEPELSIRLANAKKRNPYRIFYKKIKKGVRKIIKSLLHYCPLYKFYQRNTSETTEK